MSEITLVKRAPLEMSDRDSLIVRHALFEAIGGLGEQNEKRWRRFWNWFLRAEPGEMATIVTTRKRSGPFHRRHFKIEQTVFEAQERFEHFDQYIYWIKVGAGWVTWAAGPAGGVVPIPRSISYAEAEQEVFAEFHERVMAFLRGPHAARYLWPHLKEKANEMMDGILLEFEE